MAYETEDKKTKNTRKDVIRLEIDGNEVPIHDIDDLGTCTSKSRDNIVETPLSYCIKAHSKQTRRAYEESCPVFCPSHYRPVCGASKIRDYIYRTFNNGCYLDMINCRGDEDVSSYVEVPLEFCQRHLMKNIFKEQVVVSNLHDYQDYD
ncbi:enhancer of split M1 protein-like [Aphomia sociella]